RRIYLAAGRRLGHALELGHVSRTERALAQMTRQDPMDEDVGISADRRSEMSVEFEGQPEMADIARGIYGLLHGTDRGRPDQGLMRHTLDLIQKVVQGMRRNR